MAEYLEVEEARGRSGLRLVLTPGVPGPWGEAAKGLFHAKRVPFARVRQRPGLPDPALRDWTGCDNAPVAVYEQERPRSVWSEIISLAERLAPEPRLVPPEPAERSRMFGLCHEICGESGLGWLRRLMIFHEVLSRPEDVDSPAGQIVAGLGRKYGYDPTAAEAAPGRVAGILELLAARLREQRGRGSRFFVGQQLSALDIYWAAFAAMVLPLPQEQCPMPELIRRHYELRDPTARAAANPILLEHRDFIYGEYLELPLDL